MSYVLNCWIRRCSRRSVNRLRSADQSIGIFTSFSKLDETIVDIDLPDEWNHRTCIIGHGNRVAEKQCHPWTRSRARRRHSQHVLDVKNLSELNKLFRSLRRLWHDRCLVCELEWRRPQITFFVFAPKKSVPTEKSLQSFISAFLGIFEDIGEQLEFAFARLKVDHPAKRNVKVVHIPTSMNAHVQFHSIGRSQISSTSLVLVPPASLWKSLEDYENAPFDWNLPLQVTWSLMRSFHPPIEQLTTYKILSIDIFSKRDLNAAISLERTTECQCISFVQLTWRCTEWFHRTSEWQHVPRVAEYWIQLESLLLAPRRDVVDNNRLVQVDGWSAVLAYWIEIPIDIHQNGYWTAMHIREWRREASLDLLDRLVSNYRLTSHEISSIDPKLADHLKWDRTREPEELTQTQIAVDYLPASIWAKYFMASSCSDSSWLARTYT